MRLVDADSVIEFYKKQVKDGGFYAPIYEGVCNIIGRFPTIFAVPVVRCRECVNHSEVDGYHYCKFWRMYCPDDSDFFCKAAQRKIETVLPKSDAKDESLEGEHD